MQLYRNTQETDLFVPQKSVPEIKLVDIVFTEPELKHNSRIKDDVILGLLVLVSFGIIIGIFAFI
jgi:hypothetical protein